MSSIIIDFEGLTFQNGRFHGGGDFCIRLVDYLIDSSLDISIINNSTMYYNELSDSNSPKIDYKNSIYLNPLIKNPDFEEIKKFQKSFFYIHGLRMLEMPYDSTSYKYFGWHKKMFVFIMQKFFKNYYRLKEINQIKKITKFSNNSNILTTGDHSRYVISASANFDFNRIYTLPPLYHGKSILKKPNLRIPKNYILFLNGDRWVKNSYRFVKAFIDLKENLLLPEKLKLVVTGKPKFSAYEMQHEDIIYLDYLDREELEYLISNMEWLAYPSLNEGFGYPPLDALRYGKPVLCTSISAPNLIYNGLVVFCNPFSEIEIKSRILYMIENVKETDQSKNINYYKKIINEIDTKWQQFIIHLNE